jgi:hypothetical protein
MTTISERARIARQRSAAATTLAVVTAKTECPACQRFDDEAAGAGAMSMSAEQHILTMVASGLIALAFWVVLAKLGWPPLRVFNATKDGLRWLVTPRPEQPTIEQQIRSLEVELGMGGDPSGREIAEARNQQRGGS